MSSYKRGRRFEYEVAKLLRKWNWEVWRFAGSKPLDLLALRGDEIRFIECKNHYDLKSEDTDKLARLCSKIQAIERIYLVHPLSTGEALIVVTVSMWGIENRQFLESVFL